MRKGNSTATAKGANIPKIKVTVHVPDNVPRRQEKINRIYDILNPNKTNKPIKPSKAV